MKIIHKIIAISVLSMAVVSCGGGDGPADNSKPTVPELTLPTNNYLCAVSEVVFEWEPSVDSDGDPVKYVLEIATDNQFSNKVANYMSLTTTTVTASLERATTYFWRMKAKDDTDGESEFSSVFQFYTEGYAEENHLPYAAELISPALESTITGNSATLQWNANDPDADDVLTYDVYLGTQNPPTTKVLSDGTSKTYTTASMSAGTYYWKVVVKDNHEAASIGQVWDFIVE
ncbi:fibronectin type III domain-containing protein [Flavicella sediminum]|uniref:fibronectin type III domain-containing protein n=1 Tax=Flavicella sediminum TaxID=2585141 RepID=UPI001123391A|nr:fibronectin type III domain-containing protein [Flavicella sediminum]